LNRGAEHPISNRQAHILSGRGLDIDEICEDEAVGGEDKVIFLPQEERQIAEEGCSRLSQPGKLAFLEAEKPHVVCLGKRLISQALRISGTGLKFCGQGSKEHLHHPTSSTDNFTQEGRGNIPKGDARFK